LREPSQRKWFHDKSLICDCETAAHLDRLGPLQITREIKMKTLISALCVATLSVGTMAATMAPAQAASYNNGYSQNHNNRMKFEQRGNYAYLNGHRGDRHRHAGWRYYDGYYFPPAAFVVGALIFGGILGSIIASQH